MSYAAHPKRRHERAGEIAVWFLLKAQSDRIRLAAARKVGQAVVERKITLAEAERIALQVREYIRSGSKVAPTALVLGLLNGILVFKTVGNAPTGPGGAA